MQVMRLLTSLALLGVSSGFSVLGGMGRRVSSVSMNAFDASKTAVVLIEYQNDFTSEGGKLYEAVKPGESVISLPILLLFLRSVFHLLNFLVIRMYIYVVMDSSNMMQNSVDLVKAARAKGAKIVHVPISFSDSYNEIAPEAYGILANVKAGTYLLCVIFFLCDVLSHLNSCLLNI